MIDLPKTEVDAYNVVEILVNAKLNAERDWTWTQFDEIKGQYVIG